MLLFPGAARKIRENDVPSMTDDQFRAAARFAVQMGCYDAHDWLLRGGKR